MGNVLSLLSCFGRRRENALNRNQRGSRGEALNGTANAQKKNTNANINICSARFVNIGNENTINIQATGGRFDAISVVYATEEQGKQTSINQERQVSSPANKNIISDMVLLGEGNKIYVSNIDQMILIDLQGNVTQVFPLVPEILQLPLCGVDSRSQRLFDVMVEIINILYPLRDRGKWQEFEYALGKLNFKYNFYSEIQCFLLIEDGVRLTYQKQLEKAKKLAKAAVSIIDNSELNEALRNVLRVLANVASASIFRRQPKRKLGKAFKCLEKAKESAVKLKGLNLTIPKFSLAILTHEQGRCNMEFAKIKSKECIRAEAQSFLGLSIDRFRDLSSENLYSARQCFALIYLASLALPSSMATSQEGNRQIIPKKDSSRAQKLLCEFDRSTQLLGEIPIAAGIKHAITRSELCFHKRNYSKAREYGCQALQIAQEYGFELETVLAQNNLNQICRYSAYRIPKTTTSKLQEKAASSSYTCSSTDSDQRAY